MFLAVNRIFKTGVSSRQRELDPARDGFEKNPPAAAFFEAFPLSNASNPKKKSAYGGLSLTPYELPASDAISIVPV